MKGVERDKEGWWFWDEERINRIGPFPTQGACRTERRIYMEFVNERESTTGDPERMKPRVRRKRNE